MPAQTETVNSPLSSARRASLHKNLDNWVCSGCGTCNYNMKRDNCFRCKSSKPSATAGEVCAALKALSAPKDVQAEGSSPSKSHRRTNSERTVVPKKKDELPTWACLSCGTKNFNLKRTDCFRCKKIRGAGEVAHLEHTEPVAMDTRTEVGRAHVHQELPEGYEGNWMPEFHEGQIVDAFYKRKETDEGKWMAARVQGVDFAKRTFEVNFNLSIQKNGIQQLTSKHIVGVGSGVKVANEGPWKGMEAVITGYKHSAERWRVQLKDGRRKNVPLGKLVRFDAAGAINRTAGKV